MPCRTYPEDYPEAECNQYHNECCRVQALIDELNSGELNEDHYNGSHPDFSGVNLHYGSRAKADQMTAALCEQLHKIDDVTKYSLEMQIWWRNHQRADAKRIKEEQETIQKEADKKKALAKLTPYERSLLGHASEDDIPF